MLIPTPLSQPPQKDPAIGAFRCRSCGMTVFREAWLCDDCQAAAGKRNRSALTLCLVVAAIAIIVGVVVLALGK